MKQDIISRRDFFKRTGAAGIAIASFTAGVDAHSFITYLFSEQRAPASDTYANTWFDAFPDSLPGAYKIEKSARTPGATYALVHVRQRHYRPEATEADLAKIQEVQDDIYKTLSSLLEKGLIKGVYDEGTEPFGAQMMKEMREFRRSLDTRVQINEREPFDIYSMIVPQQRAMIERYRTMLKDEKDPVRIDRIKEEIRKVEANISEGEKLREQQIELQARTKETTQKIQRDMEKMDRESERTGGAVAKLHNEGRVEVFAAETYEANLRAQIASNRQFIELYDQAMAGGQIPSEIQLPPEVTEMREDILLDFVHKAEDRTAVTVYGGAHDWVNNVKQWNGKNPNDKFSLIVITPDAYERLEREKRR